MFERKEEFGEYLSKTQKFKDNLQSDIKHSYESQIAFSGQCYYLFETVFTTLTNITTKLVVMQFIYFD